MLQPLDPLPWPDELPADPPERITRWQQALSNRVLDIHGDPAAAELVVFSDGNHHMALAETIRAFGSRHGLLHHQVLYLTLPPRILLDIVVTGSLLLGNLKLDLTPHVMISPAPILDRLIALGRMVEHRGFMQSRGNVLLVGRDNPLGITGIDDLFRADVRLFISHPEREAASFTVYRDTLVALADEVGFDGSGLASELERGGGRVVHGESIHHREAPVAVATGKADAAVVYFHLALRYLRVFPDFFEQVPLPGSPDHQDPTTSGNVRTLYHAGCVDGGGAWGKTFEAFLHTRPVADIYRAHGLAPLA